MYYILGPADVLLLTIRIHCSREPSVDVIGFDTGAGHLNGYAREDYATEGVLTVGGPVTIHQGVCYPCVPFPCDDDNACTQDLCHELPEPPCYWCEHIPINCDDGDPCTVDSCVGGGCVYTPINCDDGDPCTDDSCVGGACIHTPIICDDLDPCTLDLCVGGVCMHILWTLLPNLEAGAGVEHVVVPPCPGTGKRVGEGADQLVDPWVSLGAGQTWVTFAGAPVPAGFFAPGSAPFMGTVELRGVPLGPTEFGEYGPADTLIARSADPFSRRDLPSAAEVTVETEIVALHLESVAPITVMVDGVPEEWDVEVGLSACVPLPGTLTATKTHCNGGLYTAEIHVVAKFTFTKVADPGEIRILDQGLDEFGECSADPGALSPDILISSKPQPWVHDPDLRVPLAVNYASAFHPSLEPTTEACGDFDLDGDTDAVDFSAFSDAFGRSFPDAAYLAQADVDADGTVTLVDYQQWLACYRCFVGNPLAPAPVGTKGDFDGDHDVDLADFRQFQQCVNGPRESSWPCILKLDFDGDGQVNESDLPLFLAAFTGP